MNNDLQQTAGADSDVPNARSAHWSDYGEIPSNSAEKLRLLKFKIYEKRLVEVWKKFEEHKIEPILIKGWAAAWNYPQPYLRRLGDFDLAVNPNEFEKAAELQKYFSDREVDLHRGFRHLDSVKWDDLYKNSRSKRCGETLIRVLRPEDHLRVLCVHWLADGGREKNRLEDIKYAVARRPADFDWERCLGIVGKNRRRWIIYTIGLAHRYYNLAIDDLPFADESAGLPDWLIKNLEKEWNNPVEFKFLETCLNSRQEFFKQLRRRLPPNPIQSIVNMEGDFDRSARFLYQIGDVCGRMPSSLRRVFKTWRTKFQRSV